MIDWDRVMQLRDDVGGDEFASLLEMFIDEVEVVIMRLDADDRMQLCHDMHFLKGCALNLGFSDFGAICDRAERQAASEATTITVDLDGLRACYSRSKQLFLRDLPHAIGGDGLDQIGAA